MGSTRRLGQGNTTKDSTPRSTVRLTPVSESVTPLESSVVNENSPDNRATNRFEYKLRIYCSLHISIWFLAVTLWFFTATFKGY